ncbi:MAG: diacylglycerol/lipid kinase family protein [Planctomycetota bacterium]|jgi:YegS/Rv2252/BmrU family lipid kinase
MQSRHRQRILEPSETLKISSALVIANPIAGRGRGRSSAEALTDGLRTRGVETELFLTSGRGQAAERAAGGAKEVDVVVSVGGDGTLNEVLSGMVHTETAIAQLPLGTANVLAHDLGLPLRVDRAADAIAAGRTTLLDTAEVNGRLTFLCVGVGIDGHAVREVERRRTGAITKLIYVDAMLRVLRSYRPPELELEIDGEPIDGRFGFVLISNVRGYGAVFRLSHECRYADRKVEVYGLRRGTPLELLRTGVSGILGRLPGRVTEFWQASSVRVIDRSRTAVPYQIDGDFGGEGDVDYRVSGYQARIVVP